MGLVDWDTEVQDWNPCLERLVGAKELVVHVSSTRLKGACSHEN